MNRHELQKNLKKLKEDRLRLLISQDQRTPEKVISLENDIKKTEISLNQILSEEKLEFDKEQAEDLRLKSERLSSLSKAINLLSLEDMFKKHLSLDYISLWEKFAKLISLEKNFIFGNDNYHGLVTVISDNGEIKINFNLSSHSVKKFEILCLSSDDFFFFLRSIKVLSVDYQDYDSLGGRGFTEEVAISDISPEILIYNFFYAFNFFLNEK